MDTAWLGKRYVLPEREEVLWAVWTLGPAWRGGLKQQFPGRRGPTAPREKSVDQALTCQEQALLDFLDVDGLEAAFLDEIAGHGDGIGHLVEGDGTAGLVLLGAHKEV